MGLALDRSRPEDPVQVGREPRVHVYADEFGVLVRVSLPE
jgi:hypothetical protein